MQVQDATTGNRDGLLGNESLPANSIKPLSAHPLPFRIARSWSVGLSKRPQEHELRTFLDDFEHKAQASVATIERPAHVAPADWSAFRVRKAVTCARFDLPPSAITDLMVPARGSVDGELIAPRDIFVQRYAPQTDWNGIVVVFAPGYGETGRTYVEQAVAAARHGYEVYALDQQWLGLSQGTRGLVDRGFGIARDIAAVTALAADRARAAKPDAKVVIAGTSLGGMATFTAIRMNELGRVKLDGGPQMPADVAAVLQSPYFATTEKLDGVTRAACRLPWLPNLSMPRITRSAVTDDPVTAQKLVAHSIVERINGRIQAFHAPDADVARLSATMDSDAQGSSPVYVLHGTRDPLADYDTSSAWVARMGSRAKMHWLDSMNHAMAENPAQQGLVMEGIAWVTR